MMKKKRTPFMLYGALGVILLILISLGSGMFSVGTLEKTKYIEAPRFCYLSCSPQAAKTVTHMMDGDYGQQSMLTFSKATAYTCNDFIGMNNGCSITMTATNGDLSGLDTTAQLDYHHVPAGASFIEDAATTVPGGLGGYDDGERVTISMQSSDVLWVRYSEGKGMVGQDKVNGKVQFAVTGSPYTLYDHNSLSDTNGQVMFGARSGNCYLENSLYKKAKIEYADPGLKDLEGRELDWASLNKPYGVYTYFCGFQAVPGFDQKIEQYNGEQAYCLNKKMYKTMQIKVDGFTYEIVNYDASGYLDVVDCCNGDETPDKLCVDHKWIDKDQATCNPSAGLFCPQSTYQAYGSKQYKRYECVDGECVSDIIDVSCNDDVDCENGEACVRYVDPTDNECVEQGKGGEAVCGDGKCGIGEAETCPLDCVIDTDSAWLFWIILIGVALLIIIIMVIVKKRMKK